MLWLFLALMCLLAAGFAVLPFIRKLRNSGAVTAVTVVFVVSMSAGIYTYNGRPDVPSGPSEQPDVAAMISSLVQRLEEQPENINGWKMLGRSYMAIGNFAGAITAFERAVTLEDAQNADTLVDLGIALAQSGGQQLSPKTISVFENALALAPNNPEALFWGGIGAFNRGNASLAADRWERLLATNPPDEVRTILVERIAAWRGEPATANGAPGDDAPSGTGEISGPIVSVAITVSDEARSSLPDQATVFVIARDPKQPAPPIAVTRRSLSEFPASVTLSDRDSMLPGRMLSAFPELEVLVRASVSGNPAAQPGDWFGSVTVKPAEDSEVNIVIGQSVP